MTALVLAPCPTRILIRTGLKKYDLLGELVSWRRVSEVEGIGNERKYGGLEVYFSCKPAP